MKYIVPSKDLTQKYSELESAGTFSIVISLLVVLLEHLVDSGTLRVTPLEDG